MVLWIRPYGVRFENNSNFWLQQFYEKKVPNAYVFLQVGAKMRNMRWTYQVALLGLYWGYCLYISSLPYERAAIQREALPDSSGDLAQFVCKINLPKKICELNE